MKIPVCPKCHSMLVIRDIDIESMLHWCEQCQRTVHNPGFELVDADSEEWQEYIKVAMR